MLIYNQVIAREKVMKKLLSGVLALMLVVSGCASKNETSGFKAGTYTGSAKAFTDELSVEVVLTADAIESVTVTASKEEGPGLGAVENLPAKIVEAQSTNIDGISGATITSDALKAAVNAALESAGVDPTTLVAKESTAKAEDKEIETDVVVLGAGGAGMSAAIEAKDADKNVVLIEKQATAGGNTILSTGGLNAAKTKAQDENTFEENAGVEKTLATAQESYPELADLTATVKSQYDEYLANPTGYFDSVELYELDTLVGGKNLNNHELVKTLCENSESAIEWLDSIGAPLTSVGSFGGASVKRIHRPVNEEGKTVSVGSYLVPIFVSNLEEKGVEVYYNFAANELLTDDNGAVVGVKALGSDGSTLTVKADSVVIATGGFSQNTDLVLQYRPDYKGFVCTNAPGIDGDGIEMAKAIGADLVDMDQIQIHPTVHSDTSALITEGLRGDGAILVNSEGKRFFDEVGTRDAVSAAEVSQPGGFAWLIVDDKMAQASNVIAGYIKRGLTVTGATVEELAAAMEVDGATLASTLETWNGYVAAKEDPEFGRTSFAEPLDTAPYYAIKVAPGVHHTMGGLKINAETEVLSADGAIDNLYAAGEVTGGVHGANRLGGNAVADIVVFGRIAGTNAAANAQ